MAIRPLAQDPHGITFAADSLADARVFEGEELIKIVHVSEILPWHRTQCRVQGLRAVVAMPYIRRPLMVYMTWETYHLLFEDEVPI